MIDNLRQFIGYYIKLIAVNLNSRALDKVKQLFYAADYSRDQTKSNQVQLQPIAKALKIRIFTPVFITSLNKTNGY
jgi:hypothetical protein